jgi:hypothetical protein
MAFPDINNVDFSGKGNQDKVREMLDYAVNQWYSRDSRIKKISKLYDAHNGVLDLKEVENVTKSTGKESKTKYVKYRLGRTKLKQLHGEFLEISLEPTVRTVNREAINKKMAKYKELLGLSLSKDNIERVRQMGYNVFPGIVIPDINDKRVWNINNFKLANEIVMQRIIEDKMQTQRLKSIFYQNFIDLTIASEIFGKVERNVNGIDTYRYIPVKLALYEESIFDPFLEQSPYLGEVRPMFVHEILTNKEFSLSKPDKEKLKEQARSFSADNTTNKDFINSGGTNLINTYTLQWKGIEPVRVKISPVEGSTEPYMRILGNDYYDKNEKLIKRQVKDGLYTIETYAREILWTATRIGTDIYTECKKEKNIIQRLNENNKYNVDFDYSGMLFCTVDGTRVSVQEVISELEKVYDDIRFMINREMKKPHGSLVALDEAFNPKGKKFVDIFHSITEEGIVRFNSSAEGNTSGMEAKSNEVGIQAVNLGQNQNLLILLNQAMDIERVMDRVTGMNDNRQGLGKATTTATANMNNIEASRSMTYDLFYFMQEFIDRTLTKLAEKTKINRTYYGEDQREFIMDDGEQMYLMGTKDLAFDNYGCSITDGKKEKDILQKMEGLFPAEINSGMLRSKDVARFWMESSFAAALRVLDNAHDELAKVRENEIKAKQEGDKYNTDQMRQTAIEDREDGQEHDKDMELLRIEGKKEVAQLSGSMKMQGDASKDAAKAMMPDKKALVTP